MLEYILIREKTSSFTVPRLKACRLIECRGDKQVGVYNAMDSKSYANGIESDSKCAVVFAFNCKLVPLEE